MTDQRIARRVQHAKKTGEVDIGIGQSPSATFENIWASALRKIVGDCRPAQIVQWQPGGVSMAVLLTLVGISLAVWILWLADRWGLGQGGELLFKVCIGVGAVWLAYELNLGVLGVLIFLAATALYLKYRSYRARQRAMEELRGKLEAES